MQRKIYSVLPLFLITFLLLSVLHSVAKNPVEITFIVHGKVYDDSTGAPIPNHEVYVSAGQGYSKTVLTGPDGNYGDTVTGITNPQTLIQVSTRDCDNVLHSQSVAAANLYAIINFAICSYIQPPQTFHIGGLLFAGEFPINNPESTGDTGIAVLYRIMPQGLVQWETVTFVQYGYFYFLDVPEGDYRIKTALTPGSVHFHSYIPTWSSSNLQWKEGNVIHLSDSNVFQADVHLVPKANFLPGICKITGYVVEAESQPLTGGEVVPGAEVLLYTQQGIPVDYRVTDANGTFSFISLPEGSYRLYIDYPGKYSVYTDLALTQSVNVIEDVRLELYPTEINGISDPLMKSTVSNIFPNPVENELHFITEFPHELNLRCTISGITGNMLSDASIRVASGIVSSAIDTRSLTKGMYVLIIRDENGYILKTEKFVKK